VRLEAARLWEDAEAASARRRHSPDPGNYPRYAVPPLTGRRAQPRSGVSPDLNRSSAGQSRGLALESSTGGRAQLSCPTQTPVLL